MDESTCEPAKSARRSAQSIAAEAAFKSRIAELGGEVLELGWLGSLKPHRVRCAAGHDCRPRPADVQQGQGICRICAGNHPAVSEAAFRALLAGLGAVPLYVTWQGARKPHHVRCAAGHDCKPWPTAVQQGQGICGRCAGNDPAGAEAKFRAIIRAKGATPTYDTWRGTHEPHAIRCVAGHDGAPYPSNVHSGEGICRTCGGREWDCFYVVVNEHRVKFGITSGDLRSRLRNHRRSGYHHAIRTLINLPATVAPDLEREILKALSLAGIEPVQGREHFDISALSVILDVADNYPRIPVRPVLK